MALYAYQFSADLDVAGSPAPNKYLIIASTPRSGSHMLGHTLIEAGGFGRPFEYANSLNLAEWKRRLGTAGLNDTIERLKRTRTTKNGVFSLKLHYPHLKRLGGMKGLLQTFPDAYFVRISRFDLLGQAISLAAAKQTGIWIQGQEGSGKTAAYDPDMIDSCLREIILENAGWDYILTKSGCRVLHLKCEEVAQNTAEGIDRVAKFLGVTPERFASEPPTVKQIGGEYAQEWRRRYLAEASATDLMG